MHYICTYMYICNVNIGQIIAGGRAGWLLPEAWGKIKIKVLRRSCPIATLPLLSSPNQVTPCVGVWVSATQPGVPEGTRGDSRGTGTPASPQWAVIGSVTPPTPRVDNGPEWVAAMELVRQKETEKINPAATANWFSKLFFWWVGNNVWQENAPGWQWQWQW